MKITIGMRSGELLKIERASVYSFVGDLTANQMQELSTGLNAFIVRLKPKQSIRAIRLEQIKKILDALPPATMEKLGYKSVDVFRGELEDRLAKLGDWIARLSTKVIDDDLDPPDDPFEY